MKPRYASIGICATAFLILLACEGPTEPAVTDPSDLEVGAMAELQVGTVLMSHCSNEWREQPAGQTVIVDLYLARGIPGLSETEATTWVERFGGEILQRFNAPILRVQMPTDRVADLMRDSGMGGPISHVRSVPDLGRRDVHLHILLQRAITDEDLARVARLGGQVRRTGIQTPYISMYIPDASVPQLEAIESLAALSLVAPFCLGGLGA